MCFYLALVYVIGFPETFSYPDWFYQNADPEMLYYELLWDLKGFVPAIMFVSLVFAFFLAKVLDRSFMAYGFLVVGIALVLGIARSVPDSGFVDSVTDSIIPHDWIEIPTFLAFYLTLPLATSLFAKRMRASRKSSGSES